MTASSCCPVTCLFHISNSSSFFTILANSPGSIEDSFEHLIPIFLSPGCLVTASSTSSDTSTYNIQSSLTALILLLSSLMVDTFCLVTLMTTQA